MWFAEAGSSLLEFGEEEVPAALLVELSVAETIQESMVKVRGLREEAALHIRGAAASSPNPHISCAKQRSPLISLTRITALRSTDP